MGIASASFNYVVHCNEPEPVVVVKRVAGHCIVMNCIVSPRYQSPPAYLVAAPRPRSSDGPARCLLTVNKTNFGIINIFVSPSHRRHLFHFLYRNNPCCNSGGVSLFGLVVLCMSSENMGRARSIVCLLFQTRDPEYVI